MAFEIDEDYIQTSQLRFMRLEKIEQAIDAGLKDLDTISRAIPLDR
jgi:hypothetical protein